jgi:hypothetical protein
VHELASRNMFEDQTKHLEGRLLEVRRWRLISASYPVLEICFEGDGRAPMRLRVGCDDWNDLPPSVTLLDGEGKALGVGGAPTGSNIFHQGPHDTTRLPFICMAGTREYHTHSSHVGDLWDNYKTASGYDLGGILTQIWNGWLKCTP